MAYTGEVADLYVILRAVTDPFKRAMADAAVEGETTNNRLLAGIRNTSPVIMGVAAAATAAIGISVKWASDFETQYTRLFTAAGETRTAVLAARQAMLDLGTATGFTGTQIAEALYHPISAGYKMADALQIVNYSAQEARISGASLDDTTFSLSSVMKAFNLQGKDAGSTMALLNAIVGEGDMRFSNFNGSIKNWASTAAMMGVSIRSMGAGIAFLTDRGNDATEASTRLTMGITMMAYPTKQAGKLLEGLGVASSDVKASSASMEEVLKKAGVTQNQLATDLQKPDGLYVALTHLKGALEKAGVSGTEADSAISKIFGGGRSDKAILSLLQNLKGLQDKYDAIGKDSSAAKFQKNWEDAQKTTAVEFDKLKASLTNLGIAFGEKLLPRVKEVMGWINTGVQYITSHREAMIALASVITGVLTLAFLKLADTLLLVLKGLVANPWGLLIMAIAAGAVEIITHWTAVKKFFEGLWEWMVAHKDIIMIVLAGVSPMLALIAGTAILVITHWKEIWAFLQRLGKDFVQWGKDVAGFFSHVWDSLYSWFSTKWTEAVAVVKVIWKGMQTAWHDTVTFFENLWNSTGGKLVTRIDKDWHEVTGAVSKEWHHVVGDLKDIWNSLTDIWNSTGGKVVHGIAEGFSELGDAIAARWDKIKSILVTGWNNLKDVAKAVWEVIYGIIRATWDDIVATVKGAWDLIKGIFLFAYHTIIGIVKFFVDDFKGFFKAVFDLVEGIIKFFWDRVTGIFNTALDFIKDLLKVFVDIIHGHWKQAWEDLLKLVKDLWHNILNFMKTFFSDIWNTLYKVGKDLIGGLVQGVKDFWNNMLKGLQDLWDNIMKFFKDVGTWLLQAGKDLIKGLVNGVKSMFDSVKNTLGDLASKIVSWKGPPEKDLVLLHDNGRRLITGLINGIVSKKGDLQSELGSITGMIAGTGSGISVNGIGGVTNRGALAPGQINIYVEGSIRSDQDFRDVMQTEMLRLGARYSTSYTPYKR